MDMRIYITLGVTVWSISHSQLTGAARLPDVKVTDLDIKSSTEIYLAWQPTFQVTRGKPKYIIRYKPKGSVHSRASTSKTNFTLKGLEPETTYIIAIRAVNKRGRGDWSTSFPVTTKPKEEVAVPNIVANVTVSEVGNNFANIYWNVTRIDDIQGYTGFRVVWKSKEDKEEAETSRWNLTLPNLKPETRYSTAVYLLHETRSKIKLGAVKFQTLEEPIRAPRNLRLKSATDKKLVVRWRHLRPTSDNLVATKYILKYKRRGAEPPEMCEIVIDNTTKAQAIRGVLPDDKYSVRIAGQFDNVTGPYTDWLRVRTLPFNQNSSDVETYHVSPEEVLVIWTPFLDDVASTVELYTDLETLSLSLVKTLFVNGSSHVIFDDLIPGIWYRTIIKQTRNNICPFYRVTEFKTDSSKLMEDSFLESESPVNGEVSTKFHLYDPYLRILPLPIGSHMVTWSPIDIYDDNVTYLYVIRILGEPFLYHLSTTVIPAGRTYHVIDDLDVQKTYSISLSVFETGNEHAVFVSNHLLVLPAKDVSRGSDVTSTASYDSIWPITSMDVIVEYANVTEYEYLIESDMLSFQPILDSDWSLISKRYPDESMSTEGNTSEVLDFPPQVIPSVDSIEDISVVEGSAVDVTCMSRGDPYPIIYWLNITANDRMFSKGSDDSKQRIRVKPENYLGCGTYSNGRTYMGSKRFLSIKSIELWDGGQYACTAENPHGTNTSVFSIRVFPKPPRPVRDIVSTSVTPFDISVVWRPPETGLKFITGYHVILMDEYDVKLRETNITTTEMVFSNLDPNTPYKISVSAYHEYAEGETSVTVMKTERIPKLGPPVKVKVTTFNGTTLQVSWLPPTVVQSKQVRLRTYLFYHRKADTRKAEEIQLHRNFTDISVIDLEPEEHYNVQVLAMSEDGQVSFSDWLNGSTYREAYMDESRPPPPPRNVFLRPETDNIIVSWLPPYPDENILVRGYFIEVLHNGTKREAMEVDYKESSVIVYEVEMGVMYQISVQAQNKAGKSLERTEEMYIREEYVTQHPVENFHGVALSSTTLKLLWDAPEVGAFTHFILSYTIAGGDEPTLPGGGNIPSDIRNYVVRSLRPDTFYEFMIRPYFKRMKGELANTTVRTYSDRPAHAPENVTLTPVNSTAVLITCSPPSTGKNGKIITYKVSFRTKRTWRNDIIVAAEENEDLSAYVTELLPFTVYEFRARAMTINGSGPWSVWRQTRTPAPAPILPKVPTALSATSTPNSVKLTWKPPEQDSDHITGYIVGYGRFIPEVFRFSTTMDATSYTLVNLESGVVYIVSVRSFNEHGESVAAFELVTTPEAEVDRNSKPAIGL